MKKLGKTEEAKAIWQYIATIEIEYFSNMHLKELPYYQAIAWTHLGNDLKARASFTKYYRECKNIKVKKDNGFFGTTPLFPLQITLKNFAPHSITI